MIMVLTESHKGFRKDLKEYFVKFFVFFVRNGKSNYKQMQSSNSY